MKIKVTQKHIDAGQRGKCASCPIALAITDAMPNAQLATGTVPGFQVGIAGGIAYLRQRGGRHEARLPPEASRFVGMFDAGQPVQPFEFEITVPESWLCN